MLIIVLVVPSCCFAFPCQLREVNSFYTRGTFVRTSFIYNTRACNCHDRLTFSIWIPPIASLNILFHPKKWFWARFNLCVSWCLNMSKMVVDLQNLFLRIHLVIVALVFWILLSKILVIHRLSVTREESISVKILGRIQ